MKTTGIHAKIVVRIELEPGEWLLDEDTAVVRIEATHWGHQGWSEHPEIWTVGRNKGGAWSKSQRTRFGTTTAPQIVVEALVQAARLVGRTLLNQAAPEEWAARTDLKPGYFPR